MNEFKLTSESTMQGDQPKAVAQLVDGLRKGSVARRCLESRVEECRVGRSR